MFGEGAQSLTHPAACSHPHCQSCLPGEGQLQRFPHRAGPLALLTLSIVLHRSPKSATEKTHKLDGKVTLQGFASNPSTESSCRVRAYPGPASKDATPVPPTLGARLGGASTQLSHCTWGFLRREA